jgi:hypothetical protein
MVANGRRHWGTVAATFKSAEELVPTQILNRNVTFCIKLIQSDLSELNPISQRGSVRSGRGDLSATFPYYVRGKRDTDFPTCH